MWETEAELLFWLDVIRISSWVIELQGIAGKCLIWSAIKLYLLINTFKQLPLFIQKQSFRA